MNKRISQLAEQAGLLGPSSRVGDSHNATERFARLNIDDCIRAASEARSLEAAAIIKQRFSVENEKPTNKCDVCDCMYPCSQARRDAREAMR